MLIREGRDKKSWMQQKAVMLESVLNDIVRQVNDSWKRMGNAQAPAADANAGELG